MGHAKAGETGLVKVEDSSSDGSASVSEDAHGSPQAAVAQDAAEAPDSEDCDDDAPVAQKTQFMSFLKTLSSFSGDLSQLSCPAFLLSGLSIHEYCAHWGEHPELLSSIPEQPTPALRMVAILRWQISTFFGAFHSRSLAGNEKKPFNPVLGEIFRCSWTPAAQTVPVSPPKGSLSSSSKDTKNQNAAAAATALSIDGPDGILRPGPAEFPRTELFVEQVSHHPPLGAFYLSNEKKNVFVNGNCGQKTRFKTTYIKIDQTGHTLVQIVLPNGDVEDYFISLPELALRGLLTGSMFLEMLGSTTVRSSTGWVALVSYLPKPWFGGEYHEVRGAIFAPAESAGAQISGNLAAVNLNLPSPVASNTSAAGSPASPSKGPWASPGKRPTASPASFTIAGNWTRKTTLTDAETGKTYLLFDAEKQLRRLPMLPDPEELKANESGRLWGKVSEALKIKKYSVASSLKSKIENEQRALRKKRDAEGVTWQPEHFVLCKTRGGALVASGGVPGKSSSKITLDPQECVASFKNVAPGPAVPETLLAVSKALANEDKSMEECVWIHKDIIG